MRWTCGDGYELDDDFGRLDFRTLERWLSRTYWSPGIRLPEILKGARNSALNLGCYRDGAQVGARPVNASLSASTWAPAA